MQMFETLLWECRAAWRAALRRPAFLALCAATMGIGIGACSVTFALVDDFVLTPPPYADPSRLIVIGPPTSSPYLTTISPQEYQSLSGLPEFNSMGAVSFWRLSNLKCVGDPILAPSRPVSRSFLVTLGVHPVVGRNFSEEEDRPANANAAIISDRLWASQYGRDRNILGRWIKLDGKMLAIVGVLPAGFQFVEPLDILTPLGLAPASRDYGNHLIVVARLASGVSAGRATRAVNGRIDLLRAELGLKVNRSEAFIATPLWTGLAGLGRSMALMFFGFGMCLLALVGANISNLLSLRAMLTRRDRALRRALGAGRPRLIAPALAEGLLIGLLGVALGLMVAENALHLMASCVPQNWMNASLGVWLSNRTRGLALVLGAVVPILSGYLTSRNAGGRKVASDLLTGNRVSWSRKSRFAAQALVIGQVALAAGLLEVSTSLAASLIRFLRADLGLRPDHVLTFAVGPSSEQYPDAPAIRAFASEVVGRLGKTHSCGKGAASWNMPIGEPFSVPISLSNKRQLAIQYRPVTAGYFGALGIPLLRGRGIVDLDQDTTEPVAIINSAFQLRYAQGEPLGQYIQLGFRSRKGAMRVVGVVADTKQFGPDSPSEPTIYVPLAQVPDVLLSEMRQFLKLHFFVPTRNESSAASDARRILRGISPEQVVTDIGPLTDAIRELTADQELDLKVAGIMTLLAILVASGGIYSIVSLSVASRKRDLGIRAALGASPQALALDLLGNATRQIGAGLAIGAIGGTIACSYLRSIVTGFELAPLAPAAGALGFLLCVGVCACLGPVLRAAHVDPTVVLQEE